jgi:hypothetical protein
MGLVAVGRLGLPKKLCEKIVVERNDENRAHCGRGQREEYIEQNRDWKL